MKNSILCAVIVHWYESIKIHWALLYLQQIIKNKYRQGTFRICLKVCTQPLYQSWFHLQYTWLSPTTKQSTSRPNTQHNSSFIWLFSSDLCYLSDPAVTIGFHIQTPQLWNVPPIQKKIHFLKLVFWTIQNPFMRFYKEFGKVSNINGYLSAFTNEQTVQSNCFYLIMFLSILAGPGVRREFCQIRTMKCIII